MIIWIWCFAPILNKWDDTGWVIHLVPKAEQLELVGHKIVILVWEMEREKVKHVNMFKLLCVLNGTEEELNCKDIVCQAVNYFKDKNGHYW